MAYAKEVGFEKILERNVRTADDLPTDLVYAGFSLGYGRAEACPDAAGGSRRSAVLLLYPGHGRLGLRTLA